MPPDPAGSPARIAALLLAAGSSSRLGTNKLLVELGGEPLIRRAARRALAAGLDPVIAVLGYEAKRIRGALQGLPVTLVGNPRHAEGMPASVHAGLAAVPDTCAAAMVLLPDMPLVTAPMLSELAERFRATGAPLVISLYGEAAAPPTLYARALFPALLAAPEGGRQAVGEHRHLAAEVRWPAELMMDLDVPEDLERLRAMEAGG
jgi:molybdenum cofactor cytidylyltransferase